MYQVRAPPARAMPTQTIINANPINDQRLRTDQTSTNRNSTGSHSQVPKPRNEYAMTTSTRYVRRLSEGPTAVLGRSSWLTNNWNNIRAKNQLAAMPTNTR